MANKNCCCCYVQKYEEIRYDLAEDLLYVPVTKLNLALKPFRADAVAAAAAAAADGLRDARVTCKLPDAPLINIGG